MQDYSSIVDSANKQTNRRHRNKKLNPIKYNKYGITQ